MPPDPTGSSILACDTEPHQALWKVLAPSRWPLPFQVLPPGSALVGGAVRDGLIGRLGDRPDLDLVVPANGIALAHQFARQLGGTAVDLDRERAIGRLVIKGWTVDLAKQEGDSLWADLHRRDFTVNAIALRLPIGPESLALIDPLNGLGDLKKQQLRAISEENLLEDPLRLLRGLRLASELGFSITDQTWDWILHHGASLASVAGERVLAELQRLVDCVEGTQGLELLLASGLLEAWTAPIAGVAISHLCAEEARLRGLTEEETALALPVARLASLLDESSLEALHGSNKLRRRCRHLRRWRQRLATVDAVKHQGFGALPEAEQLELHRQMGPDLPALLLELAPPAAQTALHRWRDIGDPLFHPAPPLDGRILQERLGLRPGAGLGQLLDHLTTERAFGRLPRDASDQQTLTAARAWLETTGDRCHD
ncbi:MAG: CCA tRNA nucleotidyltransferase [Cyanobium sp.]